MKRSVLLQSLNITPERRYRWIHTLINKNNSLNDTLADRETFTCVNCSCFHAEVSLISDARVCKASSAVTRSLIGCVEKVAGFLLDATPVNLHSEAGPVFISCPSRIALERDIHIFIISACAFMSLYLLRDYIKICVIFNVYVSYFYV